MIRAGREVAVDFAIDLSWRNFSGPAVLSVVQIVGTYMSSKKDTGKVPIPSWSFVFRKVQYRQPRQSR